MQGEREEGAHFIERFQILMQSRPNLEELITSLITKIFQGNLTLSDMVYVAPNESQLDISLDHSAIPARRLSLSETLHSLTDSPAVTKNAKRRRLQSEQIAEGERENAELITANNELVDRVKWLERDNERLTIRLKQATDQDELETEVKRLKERLGQESDKDTRLKKLERETETLQTRLSKALEDKNAWMCNADEQKKELKQLQLLLDEQKGRGHERDGLINELTLQKEELASQLTGMQQTINDLSQYPSSNNESRHNTSIASEPPSFSKLNSTDTPNLAMELEMERLKMELEEAETKTKTIESENQELAAKMNAKQAEVDQLSDELALLNTRCVRLQETADDLGNGKAMLESEFTRAKADASNSKATIAELRAQVESLNNDSQVISENLKKAESERTETKSRLDSLETQLEEEETRRIKAENMVIDSNEKLEVAINAKVEAETMSAQAESDKSALVEELKTETAKRLDADKVRVEAENKIHYVTISFKEQISTLEEDIEQQKKQIDVHNETEEMSRIEMTKIKQEIDLLNDRNEKITEELHQQTVI